MYPFLVVQMKTAMKKKTTIQIWVDAGQMCISPRGVLQNARHNPVGAHIKPRKAP
jgi:hypothetical protein